MKNIKSLFCIALAGATLSSCNDFLTLMPLNEIVYENYWTSKADVDALPLSMALRVAGLNRESAIYV